MLAVDSELVRQERAPADSKRHTRSSVFQPENKKNVQLPVRARCEQHNTTFNS